MIALFEHVLYNFSLYFIFFVIGSLARLQDPKLVAKTENILTFQRKLDNKFIYGEHHTKKRQNLIPENKK
jgi:hypothetical protein